MNNIEVLGYCLISSQKMVDFIAFCISGTAGDPTEPGVFEWLHSRLVPEAHFFTSAGSDSMGVFGATVRRLESFAVPWTDQIKGFDPLVSMNGELAQVDAFPSLQATVTPNAYMDEMYKKGAKAVEKVIEALKANDKSGFSFTAEQFTKALRGSASVNRGAILSEIEKKFGEPLFEKADREKILESIGVRLTNVASSLESTDTRSERKR